jgi:hypothetical protein
MSGRHAPDALRFPIGAFVRPGPLASSAITEAIAEIDAAPDALAAAIRGLSDEQLDTRYRPDGWTVRQVVHHLPDSHLNSYLRMKWALTETNPVIKTYDEVAVARLPDYAGPVRPAVVLLRALHAKWVVLLRSLPDDAWGRTFRHPDLGEVRLDEQVALYAWHGRHHVAHITSLRARERWAHA